MIIIDGIIKTSAIAYTISRLFETNLLLLNAILFR